MAKIPDLDDDECVVIGDNKLEIVDRVIKRFFEKNNDGPKRKKNSHKREKILFNK